MYAFVLAESKDRSKGGRKSKGSLGFRIWRFQHTEGKSQENRTCAAIGRHVVGDNGAVTAAFGHDALRGVVGCVDVYIGHRAEQDVAPAEAAVAEGRPWKPLHGAVHAKVDLNGRQFLVMNL